MATMSAQLKLPLLHHTHISCSLIPTNMTTSKNMCSYFLPHLSYSAVKKASAESGSSGAVRFKDILGSSHKWLTKTGIKHSAEDSRDLPPLSSPLQLDSSNQSWLLAPGLLRDDQSPGPWFLAPCRMHTDVWFWSPRTCCVLLTCFGCSWTAGLNLTLSLLQ